MRILMGLIVFLEICFPSRWQMDQAIRNWMVVIPVGKIYLIEIININQSKLNLIFMFIQIIPLV
jgi:hypothetical protein